MKRNLFKKIVSFGIGGCLCLSQPNAMAQIRTNWFDINPSTSPDYSNDDDASSGGRVNHLGASSDMRRVFAASEWGGLWTSFTQGLTWVKVNTFAPSAVWDVKVDPRTTGERMRVYVTSFFDGKINTVPVAGAVAIHNSLSGISISNDGGNSWTNAPLPTLNCTVFTRQTEPSAWQIGIDPVDPKNVFVGTNCGLARSFNSGGTWDYVDPSPNDNAEQIFTVLAQGNGLVDVITDNGHFRSTNNGANWTPVPVGNGAFSGAGAATDLAASPAENYVLFATNGAGNLFESDDGGLTWPTSLTVPTTTNRNGGPNVQGRINFVKTNQRANSTQFDLWYGDVNLFSASCTTPPNASLGGSQRAPQNSWTNHAQGAHDDNGDLLFQPGARSDACPLLFTSDGGIYRNQTANSPGCETPNWGQLDATPHATWIWAFQGVQGSSGTHSLYYGLQDDGNWGTQDAHEGPPGNPNPDWINNPCCDVFSNAAQSDLSFYVQGFHPPPAIRGFDLIKANSDLSGGGQINNYPSNPSAANPAAGTFNVFNNSREIVPFGQNKYAVSVNDGVYFTNDITAGTISWTSLGAPNGGPSSSTGGSLKVSTVGGPTSIYYHTGAGTPTGPGQVFRTGLPGASPNTWNLLNLPKGINAVTVYDVDPNNGNNLVICGIDGNQNFSMWSTKNFGQSWTPLNNLDSKMLGNVFENNTSNGPTNFESFGQYWQPFMVQIDPHDGNTLVVGAADAGIFITTDFGNNWKLITNPINPSANAPHIARPIGAYFSPTRFTASSQAFNVWIATQGSGVQDVLVESP